jgi:hypothetical protein
MTLQTVKPRAKWNARWKAWDVTHPHVEGRVTSLRPHDSAKRLLALVVLPKMIRRGE